MRYYRDFDEQFRETEEERNERLRARRRAEAQKVNNVTQLRRPDTEPLRVPSCGRDAENDKALCFYFSRPVTDDELCFLHDVMQRAVACMPKVEHR